MAWDDTQIGTDAITYIEWNNMVTFIKTVTSSSGICSPDKFVAKDSNGHRFYADDGITEIGRLTNTGDFLIPGRFSKLI